MKTVEPDLYVARMEIHGIFETLVEIPPWEVEESEVRTLAVAAFGAMSQTPEYEALWQYLVTNWGWEDEQDN